MELLIIIWLLALASTRVIKNVVVDGYVQVRDPKAEAPSLAARRVRAELAQKQAETAGAPGVGQAMADRFASWIANPPPRPAWINEALAYFSLLLADAFANKRRNHIRRQREREQRKRGERPRSGRAGTPYCWRCEVNHVVKAGDLCASCTPVALRPCAGCGTHVPAADLNRRNQCAECRRPRPDSAEPSEPTPVVLVIPG